MSRPFYQRKRHLQMGTVPTQLVGRFGGIDGLPVRLYVHEVRGYLLSILTPSDPGIPYILGKDEQQA